MPPTLTPEAMLAKLLTNTIETESGCLRWSGRIRPDGYADQTWRRRTHVVHRLAYMLLVGPIPPGMTLDHLCHTRDMDCPGGPSCLHRVCLNVEHLELVTGRENTQRGRKATKDHCVHGHLYTEANTYRSRGRGTRSCRTCVRRRVVERRARERLNAAGWAA